MDGATGGEEETKASPGKVGWGTLVHRFPESHFTELQHRAGAVAGVHPHLVCLAELLCLRIRSLGRLELRTPRGKVKKRVAFCSVCRVGVHKLWCLSICLVSVSCVHVFRCGYDPYISAFRYTVTAFGICAFRFWVEHKKIKMHKKSN